MGQKWVKNAFFQTSSWTIWGAHFEPILGHFGLSKVQKALKVGLVVMGFTCKLIPLIDAVLKTLPSMTRFMSPTRWTPVDPLQFSMDLVLHLQARQAHMPQGLRDGHRCARRRCIAGSGVRADCFRDQGSACGPRPEGDRQFGDPHWGGGHGMGCCPCLSTRVHIGMSS